MAQVLVRGLDNEVVARLRERARRKGRSLESELRQVITEAAAPNVSEVLERARRLRQSYGEKVFTDTADLIRADRDSR